MSYQRKILILIIVATLARLVTASAIELGNDEVYYWTYALHLQTGYFDHPPFVGWFIRLTTANLHLNNELFIRLGAIISSAIGTYLIYRVTTIIKTERAGFYAALLYTGSIYCSIIAGTFILPDSPQFVFWLWSILLAIKIVTTTGKITRLWCWFGAASGLCILSKVHGVFLWFGVFLYVGCFDRKKLTSKSLYVAAIITLAVVSPYILWNIQNHFIGYTYHGARVSLSGSSLQSDSFLRELFGEFLYNNPLNFVVIVQSLVAAFKGKLLADKTIVRLLLCCSLPLIAVLIFISLFRDTLPHWSGPAYSTLLILAAVRLDDLADRRGLWVRRMVRSSIGFICMLVVAGVILVNYYPGTLSTAKAENTGDGDFTLDMYGWRIAGRQIAAVIKDDTGYNPGKTYIIANKWFPAAHVDLYIAPQMNATTYAIGPLFEIHHYYWLNQYKPTLQPGDNAYFIIPSNLFALDALDDLRKRFKVVTEFASIPQYRSGKICRYFYVYRLRGFLGRE